jgi:hypothetical protein
MDNLKRIRVRSRPKTNVVAFAADLDVTIDMLTVEDRLTLTRPDTSTLTEVSPRMDLRPALGTPGTFGRQRM